MIILKNRVSNQLEKWPDGEPYNGRDWEAVDSTTNQELTELDQALANEGIHWGDMVSKATKLFGIKPCSSCEKRRQILNKVQEIGLAETLRQIKETL